MKKTKKMSAPCLALRNVAIAVAILGIIPSGWAMEIEPKFNETPQTQNFFAPESTRVSGVPEVPKKQSVLFAPMMGIAPFSAPADYTLYLNDADGTLRKNNAGGEDITSEMATAGAVVSGSAGARVLTLTNFSFETSGVENALRLSSDTTIVLVGDNTIKNEHTANTLGISFAGNLTIKGDGSLTVTAAGATGNKYAITSSETLTIESGTVSAICSDTDGLTQAIFVPNITINGGTVSAAGGNTTGSNRDSTGIVATNRITINDGTVTATGGVATMDSIGIRSSNITINGGTVSFASSAATRDSIGIANSFVTTGSSFAINGGTVTAIGHTRALQISDGTPFGYTNYTVPIGFKATVYADAAGTTGEETIAAGGTITASHKWVRIQADCGDVHSWGNWTTTTEPTCEIAGEKERVCSVCGEKETDIIAAIGHSMPTDWTLGEITLAATCQTAGSQNISKSCTRVGCSHKVDDTQAIAIDPTAHALTPVSAVAATCVLGGNTAGVRCTRDGCTHNTSTPIAALGHAWDWDITLAPTCDAAGSRTQICAVCEAEGETEAIPQLTENCGGTSIRDVQEKGYALFKESVVSEKMEIMPEFAVTEVIIYDVLGNVVHNSAFRIPNSAFVWDLRNSAGRFVGNGSYLVIVEAMDKNGKTKRYSGKIGVKR